MGENAHSCDIQLRGGHYNQLWWCRLGQKGRVGRGSCKGGEGMLCSTSCYTYSTSWGRGWGGITPQWECQLSHETCSVTDWWTKQTDDKLAGQETFSQNVLNNQLWDTSLLYAVAELQQLRVIKFARQKLEHHTANWNGSFRVRGFYSICMNSKQNACN